VLREGLPRLASGAIMQLVRRSAGIGALLAAALWVAPAGFATAQEAPKEPRAPHPEPRVIVNVLSVRGPHARSEVERSARLAWGRIVGCYNALGAGTRGMVELELAISGDGRVTAARRTRSTLKSTDLAVCLARTMRRVDMPKAGGRSSAITEIHVAPGDRI
jgi:hypothetical protein